MPQGLNTEIQVGLEKSEEPLDFEPDGLGQVYFGNFTSPEVYFWSFPLLIISPIQRYNFTLAELIQISSPQRCSRQNPSSDAHL
jgi:hypothetical protein